ncbi:MAG: hypothetical protein IH941_04225 [Acidobacteria bacterium]|nr:hypothetical protein [Acidobacteriota bacterium]
MTEQVSLLPVDGVEVTIVSDDSIDILAARSDIAVRPGRHYDWSEGDRLPAEHGYALAVTVHRSGSSETLLYDAST